jgi:hypothetical protein
VQIEECRVQIVEVLLPIGVGRTVGIPRAAAEEAFYTLHSAICNLHSLSFKS